MTDGIQHTQMQPVSDPACWHPNQFNTTERWRLTLSDTEISALQALASATRLRIGNHPDALLNLQAADLDLGAFGSTLADLFTELRDGYGVVLIRGLPIGKMALLDVAIIYWSIGRALGSACRNNPEIRTCAMAFALLNLESCCREQHPENRSPRTVSH
ncbi:MAG: hypothetical protein AAF404_03860, partial [Pseudomonadota bacterium]